MSLNDARMKMERWRMHYTEQRLHGSLVNLAPSEFTRKGQKIMTEVDPNFLVTVGTANG